MQRLLAIDQDRTNPRLAAYAVVGSFVAVAVVAVVGVGALQLGIAAVLVAFLGRDGTTRDRIGHMGMVTLLGGVFGFLSYVSAETAWQAAFVLAVVSYVTGMANGFGAAAGSAGYSSCSRRWRS